MIIDISFYLPTENCETWCVNKRENISEIDLDLLKTPENFKSALMSVTYFFKVLHIMYECG